MLTKCAHSLPVRWCTLVTNGPDQKKAEKMVPDTACFSAWFPVTLALPSPALPSPETAMAPCRRCRSLAHPPSLFSLQATSGNGVPRFPLEDHVPLPALKTQCGRGHGLAACPTLGLLVTSDKGKNTLSVWDLPGGASRDGGASGRAGASAGAVVGGASAGGGGGLRLVCTLGGDGSAAPMLFQFTSNGWASGLLAFTPPLSTTGSGSSGSSSVRPLLLVTDAGADAVHIVDVVGETHAGYLASPGSIAGPRGVAASGVSESPLVAVSAWAWMDSGDHVVVVYRGSGVVWEAVRVIGGGFGGPGPRDGQLQMPHGLRLSGSGDGSVVCVADSRNNRASVFRVGDGGFVRHIATGLEHPRDVEEVEGGWLVACGDSHTVEFAGDGARGVGGARPFLGKAGGRAGGDDGEFSVPTALTVVPGLGLVVREAFSQRLQVLATPDTIAMAAMSPSRVAWMAVVLRAQLVREVGNCRLQAFATPGVIATAAISSSRWHGWPS